MQIYLNFGRLGSQSGVAGYWYLYGALIQRQEKVWRISQQNPKGNIYQHDWISIWSRSSFLQSWRYYSRSFNRRQLSGRCKNKFNKIWNQCMDHVIWTILKLVLKNERFLLLCFFNVAVKCNLGHLQGLEKVGWFHWKTCRAVRSIF